MPNSPDRPSYRRVSPTINAGIKRYFRPQRGNPRGIGRSIRYWGTYTRIERSRKKRNSSGAHRTGPPAYQRRFSRTKTDERQLAHRRFTEPISRSSYGNQGARNN